MVMTSMRMHMHDGHRRQYDGRRWPVGILSGRLELAALLVITLVCMTTNTIAAYQSLSARLDRHYGIHHANGGGGESVTSRSARLVSPAANGLSTTSLVGLPSFDFAHNDQHVSHMQCTPLQATPIVTLSSPLSPSLYELNV
jgi:hypothetical protein